MIDPVYDIPIIHTKNKDSVTWDTSRDLVLYSLLSHVSSPKSVVCSFISRMQHKDADIHITENKYYCTLPLVTHVKYSGRTGWVEKKIQILKTKQ